MLDSLTRLIIAVNLGVADLAAGNPEALRSERGQSTAEYALLLVGVGSVAVFAFSWLKGSGLLEKLFTAVISKIIPG